MAILKLLWDKKLLWGFLSKKKGGGDFIDFLREMLGITIDFGIVSVVKDAEKKEIKIHLKYLAKRLKKMTRNINLMTIRLNGNGNI